jgi:hypothetical protein
MTFQGVFKQEFFRPAFRCADTEMPCYKFHMFQGMEIRALYYDISKEVMRIANRLWCLEDK